MKILVISERFPPEGSGGPLATYLLIKELAKDPDFDITVLTNTKKPQIIPGVKYIYLPQLSGSTKYHLLLNQLAMAMGNKINKIIKDHDVVYIADHSYIFAVLAKRMNKPAIIHIHDFFPISASSTILKNGEEKYFKVLSNRILEALSFEILQSRPLSKGILSSQTYFTHFLLTTIALTLADKIISVSKLQASFLIKHIPWIGNKVEIIYNPPPPIPFMGKPRSLKPLFLYLGGINVIKGFHLVIKATLKNKSHNYRIIMAGVNIARMPKWCKWSMSSYDAVEKVIHKLPNIGNIKVLGWINRKELLNYLKNAWSLLFPSICYEPLPYAVLEACMAGRIPIVSINTGFSELAYGTIVEKYILKENTPTEIANKIEEVSTMRQDEILNIGSKIREDILIKVPLSRIVNSFKKTIYEVVK